MKCISVWTESFTTYKWFFNGEIIEGATNERYEKTNVTRREAGNYSCEVSNGFLTKTSDNVTLTVLCKFLISPAATWIKLFCSIHSSPGLF